MTQTDVIRLEKFLTRELDGVHQQITESKEVSVKAHEELKDEVRGVGHRVDQLAAKVNALEDARVKDLATNQGANDLKRFIARATLAVITATSTVIGLFFLLEQNL